MKSGERWWLLGLMVAVELERRGRMEDISGMVPALQQPTVQSQKTV